MTIRDATDLRKLSLGERKKLTKEVVRGSNEMQRKIVEQYEQMKQPVKKDHSC